MAKKKIESITRGSGNVFADLGFGQEAGELQTKAALTHQIYVRIKQLDLTQTEAAERLNLAQPDVSKIKNGKVTGFSVERLIALLNALDVDVEIVLKPNRNTTAKHTGTVRVREPAVA
jgi:predicted XRE-type DNA-binding protein